MSIEDFAQRIFESTVTSFDEEEAQYIKAAILSSVLKYADGKTRDLVADEASRDIYSVPLAGSVDRYIGDLDLGRGIGFNSEMLGIVIRTGMDGLGLRDKENRGCGRN